MDIKLIEVIKLKISVIIPVYNVEKYLNRCVESILNQTYRNLEIILIDDGSTDKSSQLCDFFSTKDSRIKVIHKKNGGLSSARNVGLDNATGEYVYFIDSDDWIANDTIEYLYETCKKYDADICSAKYMLTGNENKNFPEIDEVIEIVYERNKLQYYLDSALDGKNLEIPVCTKLYKKYLFDNIRFPEGQIYEDIYTNYLLIDKANKLVTSNKFIYFYFQQGTSITRSKFTERNYDLINVCNQVENASRLKNDENLIKSSIVFTCKNYLSLLIRMNIYNINDSNKIKICRTYIKKNLYLVLKSKMTKIQKSVILVLCMNYTLFKYFVKSFYTKYNQSKL